MNARAIKLCMLAAGTAGFVFACSPPRQPGNPIPEGMRVDDAYGDVIELEQGWTDDTQEAYYNPPQGAEIIPYEWIVNLEQKGSQVRFLDPANIERFRY